MVDWSIVRETYWNDTMRDGDRKRRRQAEFLVHRLFPWAAIGEVGVMSEQVAVAVRGALAGAAHRPKVVVRDSWYY